jgi:hypothetical protein
LLQRNHAGDFGEHAQGWIVVVIAVRDTAISDHRKLEVEIVGGPGGGLHADIGHTTDDYMADLLLRQQRVNREVNETA